MLRNLTTRKKTPITTCKFRENHLNITLRTSTVAIEDVIEISHDKLPSMPEKSAFMFHHNFYPKPKVDLEDTVITQEIRQKLLDLQQKYDDIISKHSSDIGLTLLEEIKTDTDPDLSPVASKHPPYP